MTMDLSTPLTYLPGIGPKRAEMLEKELRLRTFGDLLYYFPYKHIDRTRLFYIHELTADMPFVQVKGEILSFEEEGVGRKRHLTAHFTDGRHVMDLVWFQAAAIKWARQQYHLGTEYIVFGRPTVFNGRINIAHPDIDPAESLSLSSMGLQPYYHTTEKMKKSGLDSRSIERLTKTLMDKLTVHSTFEDQDYTTVAVNETLPQWLITRHSLMPLGQSLRAMHYPLSADELRRATYRQKFEELFFIQLNIVRYTRERQAQSRGHLFRIVGDYFNTFYKDYLPFQLTGAQKRVIREIRADTGSGKQMNRLLQGDVGSGKTLVALMTMLIALDNGYQACLMAPTEILAEQHAATFREFLKDMPVRVELLTGAVTGKKRRDPILEGVADGSVQILIGTHALIEDSVVFRNLGLAVIDEQHRFGVAQRGKLWKKNTLPPHVLVMTATPIPRTLAMTLYGDLDVSVIDELPPGRKPIQTLHRYEDQTVSLYKGIRTEVAKGRQVYVVYPLIKESEKMDLQDLEAGFAHLQNVFPDYNMSKVHGKMKPQEKEAEMQRFAKGETQMLVATTVIEVGVNVPNASVMVIMEAQRFGLSQLHQLRGRVGRGADQSYCILVSGRELSTETRKRINIMCETNDGFRIAEADLKLRGPGDLEGTQQSGMAFDLKIANIAQDGQLVQMAREEAQKVIDVDPDCNAPQHAILWNRLQELRKSSVDWAAIS